MTEEVFLYIDFVKRNKLFRLESALKHQHALIIWNAAQNIFLKSAQLVSGISNNTAKYYIRFGVTRRLEMIWYAYRNLVTNVTPDRSEPLGIDESRQLMIDLNVIYVNIRGVMDNLALALLNEFDPAHARSLRSSKIGLFLPSIKSNPTFASLKSVIHQHDDWDRDLKQRRDPVAHGIPLALPPCVLNTEDRVRYAELDQAHSDAMQRREFDEADNILKAQRKLGIFYPWFMHDPDQGVIEIYPTVPDDLAHLVQIFIPISHFFTSRERDAEAGGRDDGPAGFSRSGVRC